MSRDRVFVTYPIPDPGLPMLREHFDIDVFGGDQPPAQGWAPIPSSDEIASGAAGCQGLLTLVRDRVDDALLERLPNLRAIANYGVGYDNIDVAAATARGLLVSNTPDVLTDATADLTWALLMAVARRVGEGERMVRSGGFGGWDPRMLLGADIVGATLGIVGLGRIGEAVARRASGFGMHLVHIDDRPGIGAAVGSRAVELPELLATADFVTLHCPSTPETHHLIDEAALRAMKPTAYLLNTARGPIVDEPALVRALREHWIAGAGLDVYEHEPRLAEGLAQLDNVVVLPHLGSATVGARAGMARVAAANMLAALTGERPPNLVNPDAWRG